jgi:hypothetical protein
MDLAELKEKMERMYESVMEAMELDLSKFPPKYVPHGNWFEVRFDLQGSWTPTKTKRVAYGVIRDIADLRDYFAAAARNKGLPADMVETTIKGSFDLQLIIDLANRDKHSTHSRKTWSSKAPRLRNIKRVVELKGKYEEGKRVGLRIGLKKIEAYGGQAALVVSADIVDKGGEHLSTLSYTQQKAIEAWEGLSKTILTNI